VILFPLVYDKNLGYSVQCEVVSGLIGYVQCRVSESKIYISGFDTYVPNPIEKNPIKINILGVINPNSGQTID